MSPPDPELQLHLNGQVKDSQYSYTSHLLAFDNCLSSHVSSSCAHQVQTPLVWEKWSRELSSHPDRVYVDYIRRGIANGFPIDFDRTCPIRQPSCMLLTQNHSIISEYLQREASLGRMQCMSVAAVHFSPIGAILKRHRPGKWIDLSSPSNASVNDGISPEWSTLRYSTVDHLSSLILQEGKWAYLVKADIKEAYRMIPIHPDDQSLLGVRWKGAMYIDKALPFEHRSAPKIFIAVADALQWILIKQGVKIVIHYLDDFILVAGSFVEAKYQKDILISTCKALGVPLEPSKLEGPATCLQFVGIEFDTVALELCLPSVKLMRLRAELHSALSRRTMTKHDL